MKTFEVLSFGGLVIFHALNGSLIWNQFTPSIQYWYRLIIYSIASRSTNNGHIVSSIEIWRSRSTSLFHKRELKRTVRWPYGSLKRKNFSKLTDIEHNCRLGLVSNYKQADDISALSRETDHIDCIIHIFDQV